MNGTTQQPPIWLGIAIILFQGGSLFAQPVFGAAPEQPAGLPAPKEISASDGVYDKFVLVRWAPDDLVTQYKVLRGSSPSAATLQEVSNTWQKSTWLCDYTAQPGVVYYYAVIASNGKQQSSASIFDRGHVKRKEPIASENIGEISENEALGTPQQVFLLVSEIDVLNSPIRAGDSLQIRVEVKNVFEQAAPRTEIRYFLSRDAVLDWYDTPLGMRALSQVRPGITLPLHDTIVIPSNVLQGTYHLVVVCSTNGAIPNSKIELTPIIVQK